MLRMLVRDGDTEGWARVGSHHHLESEGPTGEEATAIVQMGTWQELWLSGGQPRPNCGHAGKEQEISTPSPSASPLDILQAALPPQPNPTGSQKERRPAMYP